MPRTPLPILAAVLLTAACSHTSPYYGPGPREAPEAHRTTPPPEPSTIRQRLILIGDAGDPDDDGEPVLLALRDTAANLPTRTLVAFLGDNAYEDGIPPAGHSERAEALRRLQAQIDAVLSSGARGLFIPGNHDWARGDDVGYANVVRMQDRVDRAGADAIQWLPRDGCPGPVAVQGFEGPRILVVDTQWWFHEGYLPADSCTPGDTASSARRLRELLEADDGREVVVLGHHPLLTGGLHAGFSSWKEHLFPLTMVKSWAWIPLPVVGTVYHLVTAPRGRTDQDLKADAYQAFIRQMGDALAAAPPLIYASGHEHSLEVLVGHRAAEHLLVSGAGSESKVTAVGDRRRSLFAHAHPGFMVVDFLRDGSALLRVVEPDDDPEDRVVLSWWLREP